MNTKILVAGKEEDIFFWEATRTIYGLDFECQVVNTLQEVMKFIKNTTYGVLLLSTGIVRGDAIDLCQKLINTDQFKIIVAGGFESCQDEYKLRNAGIYCYLILPDETGLLSSAIKAATISYKSERLFADKPYRKGADHVHSRRKTNEKYGR